MNVNVAQEQEKEGSVVPWEMSGTCRLSYFGGHISKHKDMYDFKTKKKNLSQCKEDASSVSYI